MRKEKLKILQLIYFFFIFSQFIYLYVAQVLVSKNSYETGTFFNQKSFQHPLLIPFLLFSLMCFAMSWIVPHLIMKKIASSLQKQKFTFDGDINRFLTPMILRAALLEAPVIFCLVLTMQSQDTHLMISSIAISTVLFLLHFPTNNRIESFVTGSSFNTSKN